MHEYVNIVYNCSMYAASFCLLKHTFHNHYANNAGTDSNRNGFVYSMSIIHMKAHDCLSVFVHVALYFMRRCAVCRSTFVDRKIGIAVAVSC